MRFVYFLIFLKYTASQNFSMFALPNNIKIGRIEFQICDLSNISKPEPDDDEDSKLEKINFQKDVVEMENNLLTPKLHSFVGT